MALKVAINGFGRIGRALMRAAVHDPSIDIVAINDLGSVENLAYLLKYDTVYRRFPGQVSYEPGFLIVGAKRIQVLSEKEPGNLPWGSLGIDVVVESTGFFTDYVKANAHVTAGAKHVVITAPVKDDNPLGATVLMGVNEGQASTCPVTSNASCTTNSASPIIAILDEAIGIERALLSTVHGYTATQAIVDGPSKKGMKEGRAAAQNIIPTSTGAAIAVTKAYPNLAGKFDGVSLRVPVPAGSIADITFVPKRATTLEEVNKVLSDAASLPRWQGIFTTTTDELVSSDIIGEPYASIADLGLTRVVEGMLVKVFAWYDNEMGYAHTLLRHVKASAATADGAHLHG
jgi:glyceraldehyde 3-phosphate dehydrogenase